MGFCGGSLGIVWGLGKKLQSRTGVSSSRNESDIPYYFMPASYDHFLFISKRVPDAVSPNWLKPCIQDHTWSSAFHEVGLKQDPQCNGWSKAEGICVPT